MKKLTIMIVIMILMVFGDHSPTIRAQDKIDYGKFAETISWHFDMERASRYGGIVGGDPKYDVSLLFKHGLNEVQIGIQNDGRTMYSWLGCDRSVCRIVGDRLYYVDVTVDRGGGDTLIAVDLTTGKEAWRTKLIGLSKTFIQGSSSPVHLNLDADADVVMVFGMGAGRYFEVKSTADGKTLGHKVFPVVPSATTPAR